MILMDFIEKSNRCSSREQLLALFENSLRQFGLDSFVYSLIRGSFARDNKITHGVAFSYPEDWMKHYLANNYVESDPTYRHVLNKKGFIIWQTLHEKQQLSKKEKQVMNEAAEAGLKSGLCLSVHGPYGEVVGFGFSSRVQQKSLTKDELSVLYAMANQFHLTYAGFDETPKPAPIKLSDRQREILQWSAVGKSRSVIAEIMNISEGTVDDHFRHIFKKLDCNDRVFAILKALQFGLIRV